MTPARDERLLRRYLLGELPDGEVDLFEREYFESDEAFDELVAAENELIDAHLKGQLTDAEESAFARHFLVAPERQERVAFARALLEAAGKAPPAPSPTPGDAVSPVRPVSGWLGRAAALLLGLGAGWVVGRGTSPSVPAESAHVLAETETLRQVLKSQQEHIASLRDDLARAREEVARVQEDAGTSRAPAGRVVSALLGSILQRDAAPRSPVVLPAGTGELRLRLIVPPDPYRSYAASVTTAEGQPVASRSKLSADRSASPSTVELRLDARPLRNGVYTVRVRGIGLGGPSEIVGDYAFQLERARLPEGSEAAKRKGPEATAPPGQ